MIDLFRINAPKGRKAFVGEVHHMGIGYAAPTYADGPRRVVLNMHTEEAHWQVFMDPSDAINLIRPLLDTLVRQNMATPVTIGRELSLLPGCDRLMLSIFNVLPPRFQRIIGSELLREIAALDYPPEGDQT